MLISTVVFAQQKRVETSIDTTKNKIGAQFNLTLKTNVDTLSNVVFPSAPNFGKLEVIRSYVIDTIKKGDRYELIKRYGLTQFDSGRYTIPSLRVIINNKSFLTDSIAIDIANISVDTLKQKMFDIKSIATEPSDNSFIWKILLGLLLIGAIGTAIYLWTKKRKTQQQKIIKTQKKERKKCVDMQSVVVGFVFCDVCSIQYILGIYNIRTSMLHQNKLSIFKIFVFLFFLN